MRKTAIFGAAFLLACALPALAHETQSTPSTQGNLPRTRQDSASLAQRVVYRGATLIDGTGAAARANMSIVVEGDTIIAIGPAHADIAAAQGAKAVDASGLFVLPGLIDTHVHLATPPDQAQAKATLRRYLYSGITAVRSMADDARAVGELAREARVGEIPSPDIYYTALMAGPSFFDDPRTISVTRGGVPGKVPWMQAITEDTDLPLAVAMARGTSATAIKLYANLPGDLVVRITREAKRQGLRVWAHSAVFPAMPADDVEAGVDAMSHVCPIAYQVSARQPQSYQERTAVDASAFEKGDNEQIGILFREMKRRGIVLDATVRVQRESEREYAKNGQGRPPRCGSALTYRLAAQAYREGVPISAGTDGDTDWQAPYPALHEELELLANQVGMPPLQVIRSATQIGAMAAGQDKLMGTIETGKLANLVFVTRDPLADIGNLRSVAFTVKRGIVFARNDYAPITQEEHGAP